MSVLPAGTSPDAETRQRLSLPAVQAFVRIADLWRLTELEQLGLLGESVSQQTLSGWQQGKIHGALNQDQIMRMSYLLGIYEGLERIWRRTPAQTDAWVRRATDDVPFLGRAPLAYMLVGGIPAMAETRAYIDAANFGPPSRESFRPMPHEG